MQFDRLTEFMDRLTSWIIPGNSIVIYQNNQKIFEYSLGFADLENKIPMNGNELINIYSCSKIATITAALQLYEKGLFLLDDPLYEYIPEYRDMFVKNASGEIVKAKHHITLRHLFTMTAGLTYDLKSDGINKARVITNGKMDTLQTVKCIAENPLVFEPGTDWNYSLCHDVLAAVVETVSGKRFEDYVRDNIFEPLGVKDIYYHRSEEVKRKMAQQYLFDTNREGSAVDAQKQTNGYEGKIVRVSKEADEFVFGENYDSGGAGIVVSVPDYALLGSALANGGIAPNSERILSSGTIELMRTNQLTLQQQKSFNWTQLKGYGYGLGVRTMIDKAQSGTIGNLGEFGWGGAAGSTMLVDPDCKLSFFYAHHMLNPQEEYYQPRLRNVVYSCIHS